MKRISVAVITALIVVGCGQEQTEATSVSRAIEAVERKRPVEPLFVWVAESCSECGPNTRCYLSQSVLPASLWRLAPKYTCACEDEFKRHVGLGVLGCEPVSIVPCTEGSYCIPLNHMHCVLHSQSTATIFDPKPSTIIKHQYHTCDCLPGYSSESGAGCVNIDECAGGDVQCPARSHCADTEGSYTCACDEGFVGDGDMCARDCSVNNGGCGPGLCSDDHIGTRICECSPGYEGPDHSKWCVTEDCSCTDKDECITFDCGGHGTCVNAPGTYTCDCIAGYRFDGITCVDTNECEVKNGGCSPNATCVNTVGSRTCTCRQGFTGNGITCNDIDECSTNNGGCDSHATCTNKEGSRTCGCKPGFAGDGITCETCGDLGEPCCEGNTCATGAQCCHGRCVDLNSDALNCGGCGRQCQTLLKTCSGQSACSSGSCRALELFTICRNCSGSLSEYSRILAGSESEAVSCVNWNGTNCQFTPGSCW